VGRSWENYTSFENTGKRIGQVRERKGLKKACSAVWERKKNAIGYKKKRKEEGGKRPRRWHSVRRDNKDFWREAKAERDWGKGESGGGAAYV